MTLPCRADAVTRWTVLRHIPGNVVAWRTALTRAPGRNRVCWPPSANIILAAALTMAVIALLMVVADKWTIVEVRTLPHWAIDPFRVITDFGKSGWLLWPIGIAVAGLAVLSGPRLGRMGEGVVCALAVRLTFLFVAIGLPGLVDAIGKNMIGRARPFVGGAADPFLYKPFAWTAAYASLPSGHSTTAFAAAMAVGAVWPRTRAVVWTYAVLIAVSRVMVSAHHPSDVVAGAAVGVVGAILIRNWFANRRLGFVVRAGGQVRAMPGPSLQRVKTVAVRLLRQ